MKKSLNRIAAIVAICISMCFCAVSADEGQESDDVGVTPLILLSQPLAQFPGKRVTVFVGTFEPGARTPLHRHPGTEILYVLEGEGLMEIRDRESRPLRAGEVVLVEPDPGSDSFVHRAINLREHEGMKTFVIVIHDVDGPPGLPLENDVDAR